MLSLESCMSSRLLLSLLVVPCLACGGDAGGSRARPGVVPDQEGPVFYESETKAATPAEPGDLDGLVEVEPEPSQTISIDQACVIDKAKAVLVKQPVDIIVLLDNSGSMEDEAAAVEANININFASVLENSGVDYRVILISRQRRGPREESGESSTSICVQTPLSGLSSCDSRSTWQRSKAG